MGDRDEEIRTKGWPCACARTRGGVRQIKLNAPEVKRCRTCQCTRDEADRIGRDLRKERR